MRGVGVLLAVSTLLSLLITKLIVPSSPHSDLIVLGLDVGQAYLGLLWLLATHRLGTDPLLVQLFWVGTGIGATWEVFSTSLLNIEWKSAIALEDKHNPSY